VLLSNETQSDRETYGTNHAWEIEARALKVMNELDHPHVVKCIAAMRRGDSRYFMFPWAEGENLRDFWISSPRKEPSGEIILQAITQLLGIADALSHLHTYRGERRHSLPGNIAAPSIHVAPDDILGVPQIDGEETDEDDDLKMSNISIRHGNLKPENILRFGTNGDTRLGTLKIADMGLAKQHVLATSDRNAKRQITSTRYETQPYEAPEATTAMYGRSRLYDIWSMGCITLEFVIWILYGVERLTEFYNQIAGGSQLPYQYYEIPDAKEPTHAEVHRIVLTWMDHIETKDPECSQDSAIRDLLRLIREKLLVVRLPAISVSSRSALAPPALGEASSPFRATAEEVRNALKDILAKANHRPYLYTGKDRSRARPPENMLSPTAQRSDSGRIQFANSPLFSGVLGRPIRADYSLPPLQDWQFPVDNRFADAVALRVPDATFVPRLRKTPKLCERCEKLDFWTGGFFIDDDVSSLLISAQTCDFCRMLRDARRDDDMAATEQIRFERRDSNLLLEGNPFPALSIVRAPGARLTRHFQMGFPELPEPNTKPFYEILNLWLEDCNTNHNDTKIRNRDCRGVIKTRLPTRLIDVGTLEAPILRLVETQEEKLNKSQEYIALSHPWGDTRNYTPFCTLQKDAEGTRHEIDVFKQAIPYDELPATFRDAVICTRELKIQYLWIDS
jgi:serine/threonine protein kinase